MSKYWQQDVSEYTPMKYLSRHKAKTVAACIDREKQQEYGYGWFKLPNFHQGAVGYDVVLPHDGQYFHSGIGIDVIVEADSFEEASRIGRGATTHLFGLITLCTNTETSRPQERLLLEYDHDMEQRHFRQFTPPSEETPTIGTVRKLDDDTFYGLYDAIHSDALSESDRRKISRVFDRYASALRQQTVTDQFVWLFIALDALEDLFVDHYQISATKEYPCEHCGEVNEGPHHNAGKEHFLEGHDEIALEYSELRDIRGRLFHGGSLGGAADKVEELAKAVRIGIIEILDVDTREYQKVIDQDINGHLRDELMIFSGALTGFEPLQIEEFLDQPGVNLVRNEISYDIVGDQIRRNPEDSVSWDLENEREIDYFAIGYRPIGNVGKPELGDVDFEMKDGE